MMAHWSSCAVHNEPAYPAGPCDCGNNAPTQPFMPTVELKPDTKMETTWGVFQDYQRQIDERDKKIADLLLERDALIAKLREARP